MQTNTLLMEGGVETVKPHREFASDVLSGLSKKRKALPCKYIYDERGSRLFSRIMELPEYYLTAAETEIFEMHKETMADLIGEEEYNVVELGAGDGKKTRILLEHLRDKRFPFHYFPVDISESSVTGLTSEFLERFPSLKIKGIISDYIEGLRWLRFQSQTRNIVLFLGSSIGNFTPVERARFLSDLRGELKDGDLVLVGFDLKKDIDIIVRAYNDDRGLTEEFNLNLLKRINYELGGNFNLEKFRYYGTWDAYAGAIKSCLISDCRQEAYIRELGRQFQFDAWEPIHTESSYKFSEDDIAQLAGKNGFNIIEVFYDSERYFADVLWEVRKDTT